jgi:hypothetical protein
MKYTYFVAAAMLLHLSGNAQNNAPHSINAWYYEVEGITTYETRNCTPGSDVAFYSEKHGGKQLLKMTTNESGTISVNKEDKFRPAFVLNVKDKNSSGISGTGSVSFFDQKEFILDDLKVVASPNGNTISWQSGFSSYNNYAFEILKSTDGESFQPAGKVPAMANDMTAYSFNDPSPSGSALYKIRVFNTGNGVSYTGRVLSSGADVNVKVYPTAASDQVNLLVPVQYKGTEYVVTNSQGQVVLSGRLETELNTLKIAGLSAGTYFVSVGNNKQAARFIKL